MLTRRNFLASGIAATISHRCLAQQPTSPSIQTSLLIPEQFRSGPNYTLAAQTGVAAHHYQFRIMTRWGMLPASGINQLRIRLYEMQCLELAMDERWQLQSIQGAFDSLEKTPEGALLILRDPIGTLLRTPRGLQKLVGQRLNEIDKRAGGSTRRELAARLGCDPETTNPLLARMLDEISTRNKVGKIAARIGMSVAVPGLGLLALNTDIEKTVTTYLPSEINRSLDQHLARAGVRRSIRQQFLTNMAFTTTEKLVLMEYLKILSEVSGRYSLIENAAAATNETQALAVLEETARLVTLHRKEPLNEIRFIGLTCCRRKSGPQVLVASVDYLSATPDVQTMAQTIRKQFPMGEVELQILGTCSTGAREILEKSEITVKHQLREEFSVPELDDKQSK
ncbi:MAG: hypothetical protein HUJ26_13680 [Planctomycetaceae bacterium]|nr:hypothetical protein [Planctomycetaceae bacterium]